MSERRYSVTAEVHQVSHFNFPGVGPNGWQSSSAVKLVLNVRKTLQVNPKEDKMPFLILREIKATNLPAVDKKGKGKSDPYASLEFQGKRDNIRTSKPIHYFSFFVFARSRIMDYICSL